MRDDVDAVVDGGLRVLLIEDVHRDPEPLLVRFVDDRAPRRLVHVVRRAVDVELDQVRVQVGQPVDAGARFLGRLADCVQPRGVQPRPVETGMILFLHQLEAFGLVGPRRAEAHRARDAVVGVHPQPADEVVAHRHWRVRGHVQMRVRVDEAGHDRLAGSVNALGACRNHHRCRRADCRDAAVGDDERAAIDRRAAGAVDDARVGKGHRSAAGRRLGRRRRRGERRSGEHRARHEHDQAKNVTNHEGLLACSIFNPRSAIASAM